MPPACPAESPVCGYGGVPAQGYPLCCPAAKPPGSRAGEFFDE